MVSSILFTFRSHVLLYSVRCTSITIVYRVHKKTKKSPLNTVVQSLATWILYNIEICFDTLFLFPLYFFFYFIFLIFILLSYYYYYYIVQCTYYIFPLFFILFFFCLFTSSIDKLRGRQLKQQQTATHANVLREQTT